MGTFSRPLLLGKAAEELNTRFSRRPDGLERGRNRPLPIMELAREKLLVITGDAGPLLRQQPPQANGGGHLAVGKVVDNLAWRPTRPSSRVEFCLHKRRYCLPDGAVAFAITRHQHFPFQLLHLPSGAAKPAGLRLLADTDAEFVQHAAVLAERRRRQLVFTQLASDIRPVRVVAALFEDGQLPSGGCEVLFEA